MIQRHLFWLVAALLPALASAALPTATPTGDCIALSGSRVLAGDLARHDARFRDLDPGTDFGYVPDPGERRTIPLPEPAGDEPPVCVTRAARALDAGAIQQALEYPEAAGGPAGIHATVLSYSAGMYPEGTIRFPPGGVSPPPAGAGQVLWRGTIAYEPGRTLPIWAQVVLRREGGCLRARSALRRGQRLAANDAELAPCDAAGILAGALGPGESVGGRMASKALRKGEWLTVRALANPPLVVTGRQAALRVQAGAARLTLPVIPEQDGHSGDTVWVRVPATRERMQAVVVGTDGLERILDATARSHAAMLPRSGEAWQPGRKP